MTLKASPLNIRGSVRPADRVRMVTSTPKGSHIYYWGTLSACISLFSVIRRSFGHYGY